MIDFLLHRHLSKGVCSFGSKVEFILSPYFSYEVTMCQVNLMNEESMKDIMTALMVSTLPIFTEYHSIQIQHYTVE